MGAHPIDELMKTAMESIRDMVDVNTIVGDAVQTADDTVIIPVSRVAFGFAAGGGDYQGRKDYKSVNQEENFPFAGGSGAGVTIHPVAFMVVGKNNTIKLLPVEHNSTIDRIMDFVPSLFDKVSPLIQKKPDLSMERKDKERVKEKEKDKDKESETKQQEPF